MKKTILLLAHFLSACVLPPVILTAQYNITTTELQGSNGVASFTKFLSVSEGGKAKLTFYNDEGEQFVIKVSGPSITSYPFNTTATQLTGKINVGQSFIEFSNSAAGFFKVSSVAGTGADVTAIAGDFNIGLIIGDSSSLTPGTGTISGNFNYTKTN